MRIHHLVVAGILVSATILPASEPLSLDVGSHGSIEFDIPAGWTGKTQGWESPGGLAVVISPPAPFPLVLLITPLPGPSDPEKRTNAVKETAESVAMNMQETAVEPELVLKELSGKECHGYFVSATDRTVQNPSESQFKFADQGAAEVGQMLLSFTVLTNVKDSPERDAAISIIQSARHFPRQ
jgi:hypothetical protein